MTRNPSVLFQLTNYVQDVIMLCTEVSLNSPVFWLDYRSSQSCSLSLFQWLAHSHVHLLLFGYSALFSSLTIPMPHIHRSDTSMLFFSLLISGSLIPIQPLISTKQDAWCHGLTIYWLESHYITYILYCAFSIVDSLRLDHAIAP